MNAPASHTSSERKVAPGQVLQQYFGYRSFRPMQEDIIHTLMQGRNALVIMPTGGGKSICYQVPALAMPGMCIVVSPLISLMADQVQALKANGAPAAYLNSSLNAAAQHQIEGQALGGKLKLLYVSPEKLLTNGFLAFLKRLPLNLFAIDEAHCISSWGHDFRPEYTQLKALRQQFPHVPLVALTATADKVTRTDILNQLGIADAKTFLASFDRPNLTLNVRPAIRRAEAIIDFIRERPKESGIIYCLSRKSTENLAARLMNSGINAAPYHAGMDAEERHKTQHEFITDKINVIVATIAFGMGIDKSNVRYVIHYNLPKNLESYYQEIGRAGRDGLPSDTIIFFAFQDVNTLRGFIQDGGQADLQLAKLERMVQYGSSNVCRRKILLAYFGEQLEKDCGNCDVCRNPPRRFDGTVIAQKAFSCIARLKKEQNKRVSQSVLIDVLRGSARKEITQQNYHTIKTYGAGKDLSFEEWREYLQQLVHLGYLEVAYDQHQSLRPTPSAGPVLFEGKKVQLVRYEVRKDEKGSKKGQPHERAKTKSEQVIEFVFEELRTLRRQIADSQGVPPYMVFNDKTLNEMARMRPITHAEFEAIEGVGIHKQDQYGEAFLNSLRHSYFQADKIDLLPKTESHRASYAMYLNNTPIDEIAVQRGMKPDTVYGHLEKLYMEGHPIPLNKLITSNEKAQLFAWFEENGLPVDSLRPCVEAMGEGIGYGKVRIAMQLYKKQH